MRKSLRMLVLLFAVFGLAQGDASDIRNARVVWDGTPDLPDSLAFVVTMTTIVSMSEIENGGPALDILKREMRLSPDEAREVLNGIIATSEAFGKELNAYTADMLCQSDGTAPMGLQLYEALDAVDDSKEWLGAKHLQAFKAQLGPDKADRLQQFLQRQKLGTYYVKVNHKARYEETGRSAEVARDKRCDHLARVAAKQL